MEISNKPLIFTGIFFAFCLALIGGVWYSLYTLASYREEYDMLASERDSFSNNMGKLRARHSALEKINKINFTHNEKASDPLEFYSRVREAIERNNVDMISMSSSQMQGGENAKSENILTIKLSGGYYSLAKVFADWRLMPFASRIKSLRMTRNKNNPEDSVDVDVVLEAYSE